VGEKSEERGRGVKEGRGEVAEGKESMGKRKEEGG